MNNHHANFLFVFCPIRRCYVHFATYIWFWNPINLLRDIHTDIYGLDCVYKILYNFI